MENTPTKEVTILRTEKRLEREIDDSQKEIDGMGNSTQFNDSTSEGRPQQYCLGLEQIILLLKICV